MLIIQQIKNCINFLCSFVSMKIQNLNIAVITPRRSFAPRRFMR